jgi:antitoxin CcdA
MRGSTARKRPTNLSLDAELVSHARDMGINVSEACERGLAGEVRQARESKWLEENLPALRAWNQWVAENGMPYAEYREI